jgi:isoleucyl-tRNA synthetase
VKDVEFGAVDATELVVRPNLPVLGPRLGPELPAIRSALAAGDFEELADGRFRAAGHELAPDEVLVQRTGKEGWAVAGEDGVTVALDLALDDELEREGRALDLIHRLNSLRRDAGLELTDRIVARLPASDADIVASFRERIAAEVLAARVEVDDSVSDAQVERVA